MASGPRSAGVKRRLKSSVGLASTLVDRSGTSTSGERRGAAETERNSQQRLLPHGARLLALHCLALILLTLAAYRSAGTLGFLLYDDNDYVTENPRVQNGLNWDDASWAMTATFAANWHPLTWLSLQLDNQLYGLQAYGYHFTNVLLHASASVLLFLVWRKMTGAVWKSSLVAAFFAVHPQHVESVAWVAERKDVLSAVFWMLTLAAYVRYARRPSWQRHACVTASFTLGLMAKPMLVTLPVILLLLDHWPLERWTAGDDPPKSSAGSSRVRLILEKLPWFALSAAAAVITIYAQKHGGAVASIDVIPFSLRLQNAVTSVGEYVVKTLWPADLAVFYPHPFYSLSAWKVAGASLFISAMSWLAWRERSRRPYVLTGWLWFLISLLPVIGLVQVGRQAMADRYNYIPSVGLYVMLIWTIAELLPTRARRSVAAAAAIISVSACVFLTHVQLQYWTNGILLWEHAMAVTGPNAVGHNFLSGELMAADRFDEAVNHLRQAVALDPAYSDAYKHLGIALRQTGNWAEAERAYRQAIFLNPHDAIAINNLGYLFMRQGKQPQAQSEFKRALELQPTLAMAAANYGESLEREGRIAAATLRFRDAVRMAPRNVMYRLKLALALENEGLRREADAEFEYARSLEPQWQETACVTAWQLATDPQPAKRDSYQALAYARQACRGEFATRSDCLDVLAAAYANAGEFKQAIASAKEALQLAKAGGRAEMAAQIDDRLALYCEQKPYRQHAAVGVSPQ